jgi:hypothetical protein
MQKTVWDSYNSFKTLNYPDNSKQKHPGVFF